MRIRHSFRLVALAAALVMAGAATAAPQTFNASIWFPEGHPLTRFGYIDWAKALSEATAGRLAPKVFTGTALLDPASHLAGIRDGIAQVGYHAGTFTPSELPVDAVLAQLAFSYSDYFVSAFAITDMNMTDPEALAQWKRNGVVYGGGYSTVPYSLMCTKEVRSLADLKGKRVRMPGSAHSNWATSVGAVPVNVPSNEMYSGLEKGQLDCAANGANEMKTRSLWEVAKHTTLARLGVFYSGFEYGFNKDFWRELSPADRRSILDSIAVAMVRTGIGYGNVVADIVAEAPARGVAVVEPADDLAKSVADYRSAARDQAVALGRDRFKLKDPDGLITRFEQRIAKWEKLLEGIDRNDERKLAELLRSELFDKIDTATYGVD